MYKLTYGLDTYIGKSEDRRIIIDKQGYLIKWYDNNWESVSLVLKK